MPLRVRWEGSFFSNHSLALVNRELASRLADDPRLRVTVDAREPPDGLPWDDPHAARLRALVATNPLDADIYVRHAWPLDHQPPRAGKWVIFQPWEYGAIPRSWYEPMRFGADEIWAPSSYNRRCYLEAGIPEEKIRVVPLGVQSVMFTPPEAFPLRTRKRFKFLFVGGTILRKGIDLLLDAYIRTFSAADDVCLVVKDFGVGTFYRNQTHEGFIRELQANPQGPEIEYLTEDLTPESMRDLYHACDCLVHPYRGEGFGLPIAEAMACGLPVIVTDEGGASDFATHETAVRVSSRVVPLPPQLASGLEVRGQPTWRQVLPEELRARMREAFEEPRAFASIARRGNELVRSGYTWDVAAEVAATRLHALGADSRRPIHDDPVAQYALRLHEGVTRWEAGDPHPALRAFSEARALRETPDVLFNAAAVLTALGDLRTAEPVLERLAVCLQDASAEEDVALRSTVQSALLSCREANAAPATGPGESARIRWQAPIFNASGYASESRSFLEGIIRNPEWEVDLRPHEAVGGAELMCPSLFQALSGRVNRSSGQPHVHFQHGPGSSLTHPVAPYSVCRVMFETDRLPEGWAEACNRFTEVWVPTAFNRETFVRSGVVPEKIRLVPGAIDAAAYGPPSHPTVRPQGARGFSFLSVFDFTPRKGWDVLLRAYFEEFSAKEDVTLVVKVVNFFREGSPTEKVREFIRRHGFRDVPHLLLIDRECSEEEMRSLYVGSDAFVLASRGEGWGRPYMEAMAFGLPTIGTRWSGNLEFMHDGNSFLIDIDGLEPCERTWPEMPLYRGHQWAVPSLASTRKWMRFVFENRDAGRERGSRAREEILRDYAQPVVAEQLRAEFLRMLAA